MSSLLFSNTVTVCVPLTCLAVVYRREKEREEVEARRALPEALRMKEDMERAKASRNNKQKGNQG